jgi:hypothetical protein
MWIDTKFPILAANTVIAFYPEHKEYSCTSAHPGI